MRIVTLEPFLTELVCSFGLEENLVGVSARCRVPDSISTIPRVTRTSLEKAASRSAIAALCSDPLEMSALRNCNPDLVLSAVESRETIVKQFAQGQPAAQSELGQLLGHEVRVASLYPASMDDVFETFELVGKLLAKADRGREMAQRAKAQLMDWGSNFYDRVRNKRVTFLSSVEPLRLAGLWIPDMIRLASCQPQISGSGQSEQEVTWADIVRFRPDVIFVAPRGMELSNALKTFKVLEKIEGWDGTPAVKRGEVFFSDGDEHFYQPTPKIVESMGILISALAGIDSGYITPRDSFYRLRWLELQRHRI